MIHILQATSSENKTAPNELHFCEMSAASEGDIAIFHVTNKGKQRDMDYNHEVVFLNEKTLEWRYAGKDAPNFYRRDIARAFWNMLVASDQWMEYKF
jgi:hypothetical protein